MLEEESTKTSFESSACDHLSDLRHAVANGDRRILALLFWGKWGKWGASNNFRMRATAGKYGQTASGTFHESLIGFASGENHVYQVAFP